MDPVDVQVSPGKPLAVAVAGRSVPNISASTPGPAGPGVPPDGITGQVLTKLTDADYDTYWADPAGGGGSGNVLTGAQADSTATSITRTMAGIGSSEADAGNSIAIGESSYVDAAATDGIAIGFEADVEQPHAVALGRQASCNSSADAAVAIGWSAQTGGSSAVAVGVGSVATPEDSVAIGDGAQVNSGAQAIAIGVSAFAGPSGDTATNGIAIGANSMVNSPADIALGSNTRADSDTGTLGAGVAIGDSSFAGDGCTSVGSGSNGSGVGTTALGSHADADASNYAGAVGANAHVGIGADGAWAIGADHTGAGASATTQDDMVLGTSLHTVKTPGRLATAASTTSKAGLQVPPGSAPTSPVNGDLWMDTTKVSARVNGTTVPLGGLGSVLTAVSKSANYTAANGEYVAVNAASGAVTITVPIANGTFVGVKKIDSSLNHVIVLPASGTVDGDPNAQLVSRWASGLFLGDGTNLAVLATSP